MAEQQRVTVGSSFGRCARTDDAAGPAAIIDQDLLAERG
jgi:hypothetical protein